MIVARNVSIAFVEVDIVARRGRDYALVEVKTAKAPALPETGLCEEQRRRLLHARDHIRSRTREARHVEVLLAAVAVDPSLPSDAGAGPKTELRFFRIGELEEDSRH